MIRTIIRKEKLVSALKANPQSLLGYYVNMNNSSISFLIAALMDDYIKEQYCFVVLLPETSANNDFFKKIFLLKKDLIEDPQTSLIIKNPYADLVSSIDKKYFAQKIYTHYTYIFRDDLINHINTNNTIIHDSEPLFTTIVQIRQDLATS